MITKTPVFSLALFIHSEHPGYYHSPLRVSQWNVGILKIKMAFVVVVTLQLKQRFQRPNGPNEGLAEEPNGPPKMPWLRMVL